MESGVSQILSLPERLEPVEVSPSLTGGPGKHIIEPSRRHCRRFWPDCTSVSGLRSR